MTGAAAPRRRRLVRALIIFLGCVFALAVAWVVSPITLDRQGSASMAPTLAQGELVVVRGARAFCGRLRPQPGDVVAARIGGGRRLLRVAAGTRASVELRDGVLVVNGRPAEPQRQGRIVRETLAGGATYETQDLGAYRPGDNFGPVRVPRDAWFLIGDNRDEARDSRHYGVVAQSDICGVADKVLSSGASKRIGRRP